MAIDIQTTTAPIEVSRPAPIEVTTPIRPSEAMRLGCLTAPVQSFGGYGSGNEACAVGAMSLGFGLPQDAVGDRLNDISHLHRTNAVCPASGLMACDGVWSVMVFHLNDDHRWSRERIADWLESLGL